MRLNVKKSLVSWLVLGGVLGSTPVMAETLSEALAKAYTTNPSLKAQRAYLRSVDEDIATANSGWRPSVSASGYVGSSSTETKNDNATLTDATLNPSNASLNVSQPLFNGFSTIYDVRSAKSTARAEEANLKAFEQSLLLSAAQAYLDVVRDKAVYELQKNNEAVLKKHLEATKDRFEVGETTRTDVSQAEARYAEAKANRISAEGSLMASRASYTRVIGNDPAEVEDVEIVFDAFPKDKHEVISLAEKDNLSVISAKHAFSASKANVGSSEGALLPTITLEASASKGWDETSSYDESETTQILARVNIPLYSAGATRSRIRKAKHLAVRSKDNVEDAIRSAVEEASSSWETYMAEKASIVSIKAQIEAATVALDGVEKEASVGSRTVLDVLDAEQELLDAKVEYVRARRDELLSVLQVMSSIGRLDVNNLKLAVKEYDSREYYNKAKNKWLSTGIK